MKWKSSSRKICRTQTLFNIVIIALIVINASVLTNNTIVPSSTAANPSVPWNITLTINESSGAGNAVGIGVATNASDGQDSYDIPAPPIPPQFPAIAAWFETPFPVPFNTLIKEFKHYPSTNSVWNLSIIWLSAPGNTTSTNITIHWDSSQILKNTNIKLFLYENNTVITDMLTTNSYSYIINITLPLHQFQIISQSNPSNNSSEQNKIQIPSLLVYGIIILIMIIIAILFLYKRRNKSQVTQIELNKSHETENKSQVTQMEPKKSPKKRTTPQVTEIKTKKSPKKRTSQVTIRKQKKSPKKSQRKKQ